MSALLEAASLSKTFFSEHNITRCLLSAMSALVLPPANVWGWLGQAAAAKAPWHVCLWD